MTFDQTDHRPYPLPDRPWTMFQRWQQLLFAHWPIAPETVRPHVPDGLELDLYEGQAWVGVVPFRMSGIHPRFLPPVPWLSRFLELNVRTYVVRDGKPGVWFTSLEAANPVGVWAGRHIYHLPYRNARMQLATDGQRITYHSQRTHKGAPPAEFAGQYWPTSDVYQTTPDSLEYFLTERYCLYAQDKQGRLYRGEIHHQQWPLQDAAADIQTNSVVPFELPDTEPLLHYADEIAVRIWPLQPLDN